MILKIALVSLAILIVGSLISILTNLFIDWLRKKTDSILVPIAIVMVLSVISAILIMQN